MEDDEQEGGDLMRMRAWLRGSRRCEICKCFYGYGY